MASAPASTPSKEGHPAAHRSRLPEGLDGSGTRPVAVEIHQGRGGPEVSPGSTRRRRSSRMADLRTRYLGLELRSPLVASSSPLTGSLEGLRRLEAAGAGAVVLPSLFEEDLAEETEQVEALRATGATGAEARAGHPDQAGYGAGPAAYLSLVAQAKQALSVPVIASLNGVSRGGWVRYAGPTGAGRGRRPGAQHLLRVLAAGEFLERGRVALPGRGPGGAPGHRDPAGGQAQPLFQLAGQPGRAAGRGRRPTGWSCSTASTSPTWTSRPWRCGRRWS